MACCIRDAGEGVVGGQRRSLLHFVSIFDQSHAAGYQGESPFLASLPI